MTVDLRNIDLSNVQANAPLEAIPSGWYNAIIVDTNMKETSDKTGQYMEIVSEIAEGPHKGRKLFDRLNLVNNNAQAVSIAYGTLKQIYNAVGKARVNSSAELHGIPLKVKVTLRAAETKGDKHYEARNEVKGYDHIASDHALASGVSTVPGVAGQPGGVPAWATGNADAASPAATPATIPTAAQPWAQPGAPTSAPAPAPLPAAAAPAGITMTSKANGLTKEDFYKQGWTDDTLVEHGYATRPVSGPAPAPLPAPAPTPAAPTPPFASAPAPATSAPGGPVPPWAQ